MPTDKGGKLAIAVTVAEGNFLISAYTLFVVGIVSFIWGIVVILVLMFYPTGKWPRKRSRQASSNTANTPASMEKELLEVRKRKTNRCIALMSVVNSNGPLSSMLLLCEHAFVMFFRASDGITGTYDVILIMAAFLVLVGSNAASTLIPSFLHIGDVAPPKSRSIFYAIPRNGTGSLGPGMQALIIQHLGAPATQRAVGTVEIAGLELVKHVHISNKTTMPWKGPGGEVIEQITYDYKITGLGFGLQLVNSVDFFLSVQGACTLEYGWFNASESDFETNVYDVFDVREYVITIEHDRPVGGSILVDSRQNLPRSNTSYAIIPDTVGRTSAAEGTDPWYLTNSTARFPNKGEIYYPVAGERPILSCWETNLWSYKGHIVDSVFNISDLPGLDLPASIRDEIFPFRLASPMINEVASHLGNSILVSSTDTGYGLFNANSSSYATDLQHLLFASYVSTKNILLDTTLVNTKNTYGLQNSALGSSGTPKPGVDGFVIQGNDVVTLSPEVLALIPLLMLFLWIVRAAFTWKRFAHKNNGKLSRLTLRAAALQPSQLYRILDEEMCGFRDDWANRKGRVPYITESRRPYTEAVTAEIVVAAGTTARSIANAPEFVAVEVTVAGGTAPDTVTGVAAPDTTEVTAAEVTAPEVGALAPEVTAAEVVVPEIAIPEVAAPEVAAPKGTTPDTTAEVTATEVTAPEVTTAEVVIPEIAALEVGAPEVTTAGVVMPEIAAAEVAAAEIRGDGLESSPAHKPEITPPHAYPTFAAPRIVKTLDGNYNLGLAGPLNHGKHRLYEDAKMAEWSWKRHHEYWGKVVADGPDHQDIMKEGWFRRHFWPKS